MSSASVANLVIGVLVLGLVLARQLMPRRLRENYRLPAILAIIGVVEFVGFLKGHPNNADDKIVAAVVGSLVIAAVFGAARAPTVQVWRQDGQLLRKGTWLTALLWIAGFAAHLGYDYLVAGHVSGKNGGNVGDATVLLYLVITLTVQQFILLRRVAREEAAGQVPVTDSQVPQ